VLSHIIRLRLAYEGAAPGAPETLIVKAGHPDRTDKTWHAGRHEVAFYDKVGAATAGRLVPRCCEAAWEQATNAWHLLLEDLAPSHAVATVWPLPPSTAQCEGIIAAWWDDPRLGAGIGEWGDSDAASHLKRLTGHYARFADQLGDRLPPPRRTLYERFSLPRRVSMHATARIAISPSCVAIRMSGTACCRATAASRTSASSIGTAGASIRLRTTLPTRWPCTGIPNDGAPSSGRYSIATMARCRRMACATTIAARSTTTIACRCCGCSRGPSGRLPATSRR
jgi:hypothetical protein